MNLWIVHARRIYRRDGWTGSEGIPTFYLDGDACAITSDEHAERIARKVLGDGWASDVTYSVSVAKYEPLGHD